MGSGKISLEGAQLQQKITQLGITKESLSGNSLIPSLQFGANSPSETSSGDSVVSMATLNAELDAVAQKLTHLIEATGKYLEGVLATFEKLEEDLS